MKRFYCWFDSAIGRWILQGKELHCGDCFQIQFGGNWIDVRIEMADSRFYLVGVPRGYSKEPDAYEARLYEEVLR